MLDGREVWADSCCDYVKNAIKTDESLFEEDGEGYILKNKVKNPFRMNYKPELDMLDELGPELSSHYLQLVGICQWAIELGCIDISHEISLLSQYKANPRIGHLEVLYNVFAYLKSHLDMEWIAHNSLTPELMNQLFTVGIGVSSSYGDVQEEMPPKMAAKSGNKLFICLIFI
jgi:hypothetical protein